jgi:hypothetical protein
VDTLLHPLVPQVDPMTGPSSTPRGEHTPRPGITWERQLVTTETVIDDTQSTSTPGMNEPQPPRPNRATRRAMARKKEQPRA